jgi:hypothetical protein
VLQLESRVVQLHEQGSRSTVSPSSAVVSPVLTGFDTPEEQMQIQALTTVMTDNSDEQFDDFDALNRDLAYQRKLWNAEAAHRAAAAAPHRTAMRPTRRSSISRKSRPSG